MNVHPRITSAQALDAGRVQRRLRAFPFNTQSINTQIRSYGKTLVARSRHLAANNAYACAAKEAFVSALVGSGIKPSSLVEDKERKKRIMKAFLRWTDECDADGRTDFFGIESMVASEMFEAGECFVRIRPRRTADGLSVPLQLQVIPSEMLPLEFNEPMRNGRFIESGIEFDSLGRRRAYHFFRQHPGDKFSFQFPLGANEKVVVPAEQVLHIFRPVRAGQVRGLPHTASGIIIAAMLDLIDDAELERKRTTALFAGFIERPLAGEGMHPLGDVDQDSVVKGDRNFSLEPGALIDLELGEKITFSEPADVGGSYEAFQYRNLLRMAAGFGIPYSAMTGDLRQTSYSSIRAGLIEFRRRIEAMQHHVIVPQFCAQIWRRWMDAAVVAGAIEGISPVEYESYQYEIRQARWIPPRWEWVDPEKDLKAEKLAVDEGFKSRGDVIESMGFDAEEVDERISQDQQRAETLGLKIGAAAKALPEDPAQDDEEEDDDPKPPARRQSSGDE